MRGVWTRERIALLKKLWADGETATAIATRLRMSKSAVLGKVFRLRLPTAVKATAAAARRAAATVGRRRVSGDSVERPTAPSIFRRSPRNSASAAAAARSASGTAASAPSGAPRLRPPLIGLVLKIVSSLG